MKILIPQNLNGINILRKSGYGMMVNRAGVQSFVRRLARNDYPRFHVYVEGGYINLHLDQKQASYDGYSAHSGEYDGEVVEREGERIKSAISELQSSQSSAEDSSSSSDEKEEKGFWGKLFG